MSGRRWWWRLARRREHGLPPSGNGASSFHLWWLVPAAAWRGARVTLEVLDPPRVPRLYFWALQVSFSGPQGRSGGAHTGLQWNPRFPASTAVNWGGYRADGGLMEGSVSSLPSTPGDANTRDFPWQPGVPYRLQVEPTPGRPGWWRATVTDLASGWETAIRDLAGGGDRLEAPVVWSEVFAACDDPSVRVRWSDPALLGDGDWISPFGYRVSYQPYERGGCTNTDVRVTPWGVEQVTATPRLVGDGEQLPLEEPPSASR